MIVAAIWLAALIVTAAVALGVPWWVLGIGFALGLAAVFGGWWWARTWAGRN